jgi:hypothetical protein
MQCCADGLVFGRHASVLPTARTLRLCRLSNVRAVYVEGLTATP